MTETISDHDRFDVDWLGVESRAESFRVAQGLSALHLQACDQWAVDYEHEHRFAEHEHEEELEPANATEGPRGGGEWNGAIKTKW